MYFFTLRLKTQDMINQTSGIALEDRTIFEDKAIFGQTNFEEGNMHALEFEVYSQAYKQWLTRINHPTLLIYLKVTDINILIDRIKKRGRVEEKDMSEKYLRRLNINYNRFYDNYPFPKMIIDADQSMDTDKRFHKKNFAAISHELRKLGYKNRPPPQKLVVR